MAGTWAVDLLHAEWGRGRTGQSCRVHASWMVESTEVVLVGRFYEVAWTCWDNSVVDELLCADVVFRGSLGDEVVGRDGWRAYRDKVRAAVPDFRNEDVDVVVSPGRAAVCLRCTGHHRGLSVGVAGSGGAICDAATAFFTVADGCVRTAWVLGDLDELRRQIAGGGAERGR